MMRGGAIPLPLHPQRRGFSKGGRTHCLQTVAPAPPDVLGPGLAKAIPNAKVHQIPSSTDTFPYRTPWRVALHNASDSSDTKKSAAALTA